MAAGGPSRDRRRLAVATAPCDDSASTLRAITPTATHAMKVQGFSWMRRSNPSSSYGVVSPSFRVGDTTRWHLVFYPNGNPGPGFVSVKAVLDDACRAVKAMVAFDVLDLDGRPVPRCTRTTGEVLYFPGVGASWTCHDFVETAELERRFLKDDCFTLRCTVTVIRVIAYGHAAPPSPSPRHRRVHVPPPPSDLPQHLLELYRSGEGKDVWFRVGGETFGAHRCVLAALSPVFKAELYGAMKESVDPEQRVQIDGMRAEVFRNLLHFAYTGELPPQREEKEAVVELEEEEGAEDDEAAMAQHLLEAADRYDMERLKQRCEQRLRDHIGVSTVATTLALAEQHHCKGLKQACIDFLLGSPAELKDVMARDDFDHVCKICPDLLKDLVLELAVRCSKLTEDVSELGYYKKVMFAAVKEKEKKRRLDAQAQAHV